MDNSWTEKLHALKLENIEHQNQYFACKNRLSQVKHEQKIAHSTKLLEIARKIIEIQQVQIAKHRADAPFVHEHETIDVLPRQVYRQRPETDIKEEEVLQEYQWEIDKLENDNRKLREQIRVLKLKDTESGHLRNLKRLLSEVKSEILEGNKQILASNTKIHNSVMDSKKQIHSSVMDSKKQIQASISNTNHMDRFSRQLSQSQGTLEQSMNRQFRDILDKQRQQNERIVDKLPVILNPITKDLKSEIAATSKLITSLQNDLIKKFNQQSEDQTRNRRKILSKVSEEFETMQKLWKMKDLEVGLEKKRDKVISDLRDALRAQSELQSQQNRDLLSTMTQQLNNIASQMKTQPQPIRTQVQPIYLGKRLSSPVGELERGRTKKRVKARSPESPGEEKTISKKRAKTRVPESPIEEKEKPKPKRRGRPKGSKNKKTLERLRKEEDQKKDKAEINNLMQEMDALPTARKKNRKSMKLNRKGIGRINDLELSPIAK